ncbi:fumarylacetoacetate hydrolase family protein [Trichococcus shcherbakoviae]|uniref:fumarylacetoacetate hydrolase family protein n=1 Tax=Trichococcus shcherbakoviae TaxID=2094020 RepID=UPI0029F55920|nr:fumarylacetoacetate hydrolase family protein [Trichococcus shcherbakoviae]
MQLIHFSEDGQSRIGIKTEQGFLNVAKVAVALSLPFPSYIDDVLKDPEQAAQLAAILAQAETLTDPAYYVSMDEVTFLPVLSRPGKILCIGKNYAAHVAETKSEAPKKPLVFSKFTSALAAHKEGIPIPVNTSKVDYEVELVAVIGKKAYCVSPEEALEHVAGYTIGNDVTARDWQKGSPQWLLGKSPDKFAPLGPVYVTADEIDPRNLDISLKLNNEVRQNSNTKHLIFDIATIVSYISQHFALEPGDIIFTGTPDGVILGYPEDEQVWLKPGDVIESTIEGIGTLVNTFR